jgi:hypothetical protein
MHYKRNNLLASLASLVLPPFITVAALVLAALVLAALVLAALVLAALVLVALVLAADARMCKVPFPSPR